MIEIGSFWKSQYGSIIKILAIRNGIGDDESVLIELVERCAVFDRGEISVIYLLSKYKKLTSLEMELL
jgi:hypothetical protein